ncbi:MAG: AmmeMemoRadiSam system protein A [archaeon]|nr:MAG: AmmeMemoRadiSam system protein A [archaeon]
MLTKKQGSFLVKFARDTISRFVRNQDTHLPGTYPREFDQLCGVFVTLDKYPSGNLRGCIGIPMPEKPLIDAVRDAACSSARDPRFPPLVEKELNGVTIEVSVLTKPEKIVFSSPEELLKKIEPGKDGLILKKSWCSGLFLPQVWKQLPKKERFLESLCYKAGLRDGECWKDAEIYRFRVQAFREKEPEGQVI